MSGRESVSAGEAADEVLEGVLKLVLEVMDGEKVEVSSVVEVVVGEAAVEVRECQFEHTHVIVGQCSIRQQEGLRGREEEAVVE